MTQQEVFNTIAKEMSAGRQFQLVLSDVPEEAFPLVRVLQILHDQIHVKHWNTGLFRVAMRFRLDWGRW